MCQLQGCHVAKGSILIITIQNLQVSGFVAYTLSSGVLVYLKSLSVYKSGTGLCIGMGLSNSIAEETARVQEAVL